MRLIIVADGCPGGSVLRRQPMSAPSGRFEARLRRLHHVSRTSEDLRGLANDTCLLIIGVDRLSIHTHQGPALALDAFRSVVTPPLRPVRVLPLRDPPSTRPP